MSTPVLPDYAAPFKPVPNVTPFTIRDGATMLKKIDYINKYIDRVLIPWINENFAELADDFEEQVNILIAAVNATIQAVIDDSIELQDPVMATIVADLDSQTRTALDAIYAKAADLDATDAEIVSIKANLTELENLLGELTSDTADNLSTLDAKIEALELSTGEAIEKSAGKVFSAVKDGFITKSGGGLPYADAEAFITGIPGVIPVGVTNFALNLDVFYSPFTVTEDITPQHFSIDIVAGPAGPANLAMAIYAADHNWQPVDRFGWQNVAVAAGQTGNIFTPVSSSTTLKPGRYLMMVQASVAMTLRMVAGGPTYFRAGRGAAQNIGMFSAINAFQSTPPANGVKWNASRDANTLLSPITMRWVAASSALTPRASHYLLDGGELVKGVNLTVNLQSWGQFWGDQWDWDGWVKPMIDNANTLGVNVIRSIGSVIHVYPGANGYFTGSTIPLYVSRWRQIINYCATLGIKVYVCGGGYAVGEGYDVLTEAQVTTVLTALGAEINGDPNVIAYDILQESYSYAATYGGNISAAIRAVCDKPITWSQVAGMPGEGTGFEATYAQGVLRPFLDFYDYHAYWDFVPSDVDVFFANNTKPLLIGEYGSPVSAGDTAHANRSSAVRGIVNRVTPDGKHAAGMIEWAITDQEPVATGQWGIFDINGVPRTNRVNRFALIPTSR